MKSKRCVLALACVLLASSAAAALQIPRCWVLNCRGAYKEKCMRCLMANCGNRQGLDPAARHWCFSRPRLTWPAGTPGVER